MSEFNFIQCFLDFGLKRIGVSSLDGSFQKVLLYENIESPRAIALHYTKGLVY